MTKADMVIGCSCKRESRTKAGFKVATFGRRHSSTDLEKGAGLDTAEPLMTAVKVSRTLDENVDFTVKQRAEKAARNISKNTIPVIKAEPAFVEAVKGGAER